MKKEKQIQVIKVEPGKEAYVTTIENDLKALQKIVSEGAPYVGLIESLCLDEGVDIVCNEEGKLLSLKPCRRVVFDIIVGTFIIAAVDNDTGEYMSLSNEQIEKYLEQFKAPEDIQMKEVEDSISIRFVPF